MNIMDCLRRRRSVREYRPDPLPPELVASLTEALRIAPSACNYQPWRFILVHDEARRRALGHAAREQMFFTAAPIVVVGCGFPGRAYKKMGGYWNSVEVDVALALDHLMLAAAGLGLGTCWIGAFEEDAVKAVLGIPPEVKVVAMTPLGWPARDGLLRPVGEHERKPQSEIFSTDQF